MGAGQSTDANAGPVYARMLASASEGGRRQGVGPWSVGRFNPIPRRHNATTLAAVAGSYGRHAEPLDQRAREDRYRRQTGRLNRCEDDVEAWVELMPPARQAAVLGLTSRQRRRSQHKANRADALLISGHRR